MARRKTERNSRAKATSGERLNNGVEGKEKKLIMKYRCESLGAKQKVVTRNEESES